MENIVRTVYLSNDSDTTMRDYFHLINLVSTVEDWYICYGSEGVKEPINDEKTSLKIEIDYEKLPIYDILHIIDRRLDTRNIGAVYVIFTHNENDTYSYEVSFDTVKFTGVDSPITSSYKSPEIPYSMIQTDFYTRFKDALLYMEFRDQGGI